MTTAAGAVGFRWVGCFIANLAANLLEPLLRWDEVPFVNDCYSRLEALTQEFTFVLCDFFDATLVTTTFEGGVEPGLQHA